MRKNISKIINNKKFIIAALIVLISLTAIVGTFAWFTWNSTENTSLTMTIGKLADVTFTSGNDITTGLTPVFYYYDGEQTTFSITNKSNSAISYTVKLNIETIDLELTNDESVKYAITRDGEIVAQDSLKDATNGDSIPIYTDTSTSGTTSYIFYLYIDANMENKQEMMNKTITGTITVEAAAVELINLKDYITNLYSSNTTTINNEITYNLDETNKLMEDTGGNIRYYGAGPNNYIYFNCETYPSTDCETWRIIGIVDGKVKIIKNSSIGSFPWDLTSIGDYDNNWNDATLMTMLNGGYYNNEDNITHYYNNYMGQVTSSTINFNTDKLGITDKTREKTLISSSTWYINQGDSYEVYPNDIYDAERTGNSMWSGNIALMYPSDYGYASDLSTCKQNLTNYNDDTCAGANWISRILSGSESTALLTPYSSSGNSIFRILSSYEISYYAPFYKYEVLPVLYLDTTVNIGSNTNGSSGNPFQIYTE